jgi:hypothetical protein
MSRDRKEAGGRVSRGMPQGEPNELIKKAGAPVCLGARALRHSRWTESTCYLHSPARAYSRIKAKRRANSPGRRVSSLSFALLLRVSMEPVVDCEFVKRSVVGLMRRLCLGSRCGIRPRCSRSLREGPRGRSRREIGIELLPDSIKVSTFSFLFFPRPVFFIDTDILAWDYDSSLHGRGSMLENHVGRASSLTFSSLISRSSSFRL